MLKSGKVLQENSSEGRIRFKVSNSFTFSAHKVVQFYDRKDTYDKADVIVCSR
jgi:hypothetical protein